MTTAVVPRVLVDPPQRRPNRFGLFNVATIIDDPGLHELTGIKYDAVTAPTTDPYPAKLCPDHPKKTPRNTVQKVEADPFALYAADECVLGRDENEARAQLRQRFLAAEERAVEREVWYGTVHTPGIWPQAEMVFPRPANEQQYSPDIAFGILEAWVAKRWGGEGVIHAPAAFINYYEKRVTFQVRDGRMTTEGGVPVSFGYGYGAKAAKGYQWPLDGNTWLYATPPVTIRRGPLVEPASWSTGAFDKAQNAAMLLVERQYVVDWAYHAVAIRTEPWRKPLIEYSLDDEPEEPTEEETAL